MQSHEVLDWLAQKQVRYVDLRFTDTRGKEQHVTLPITAVSEALFVEGQIR